MVKGQPGYVQPSYDHNRKVAELTSDIQMLELSVESAYWNSVDSNIDYSVRVEWDKRHEERKTRLSEKEAELKRLEDT